MLSIINFGVPEITGTFGFLVELIKWLGVVSGSIALAVVLFTIILKAITLPFDFISRVKMRKNSLKMEEMRPELERLQKQYADNKELYNQKMMALYKKNGYSMFGSCLPMILSIVIFIIAINAFNNYSRYENRRYFYEMSKSYNAVIYRGLEVDDDIVKMIDDEIIVDGYKVITALEENKTEISKYDIQGGVEGESKYFTITSDNSYVIYKRYYTDKNTLGALSFSARQEGLVNSSLVNSNNQTFSQFIEVNKDGKAEDFIKNVCQMEAARTFKENGSKFFWVKNIWVADSAFSHPVEADWKTFAETNDYSAKTAIGGSMDEGAYNELTAQLEDYKNAPNGYFILVVLCAGTSLLLQLITSKSQKAQMELQTVDGQGAQTQKMMNWMMPIMMAMFAFMYTSAFSIYIIVNSVISILSTFVINKIVDVRIEKQKPKEEVIHGRIYEPKEKEQPKKPVKKEKEINKHDFLSGYGDKRKKR